ncbi:phosphatidylglycerophosphatase A, partial [uncultured Pseudomonas sp.]
IWLLVGFVAFRVLDICKPWPIRWLDVNVRGGVGIMVDDVLAGILAWLVVQGLHIGWGHLVG